MKSKKQDMRAMRKNDWLIKTARETGITPQAIERMQLIGRIKVNQRIKNPRCILILPPFPKIESRLPRKGEILLKTWLANKAIELGKPFHTIQQAYYRGKYPLNVRKINNQFVFVKI